MFPSSIHQSGCQLWDCSLAHTLGKSTGVVPRNHSREISVSLSYSHKLLNQTKLKAFEDNITHVTKMMISVFIRVENIVCKGENACTINFSFSHNVFKRLLSQTFHKVSLCGNGLKSFFLSVPMFELSLNGWKPYPPNSPAPILYSSVAYRTWEQVVGLIPGTANILSVDQWWSLQQDIFLSHTCPCFGDG